MPFRRADVLTPVELDWIAAGPGFPFAGVSRALPMRCCLPCGIETAEESCFECGQPTESFGTRTTDIYFEH
jgi:hypothetical protein